MAEEYKERSHLEKVYDRVFDKDTGLEAQVSELDERTKPLERFNDIVQALKWPIGILAGIFLSAVGAWLVEWLRIGGP